MRNRMEPVASISERMLLRAYGGAERAVRCACGGFVVANPVNETLVELAVQAHQRTLGHMSWWAGAGW